MLKDRSRFGIQIFIIGMDRGVLPKAVFISVHSLTVSCAEDGCPVPSGSDAAIAKIQDLIHTCLEDDAI